MPKLILRCACEIAGVDHQPGDEVEVDEDNAVRMLRKGMAVEPKKVKSAPKKKAKAASSEE